MQDNNWGTACMDVYILSTPLNKWNEPGSFKGKYSTDQLFPEDVLEKKFSEFQMIQSNQAR